MQYLFIHDYINIKWNFIEIIKSKFNGEEDGMKQNKMEKGSTWYYVGCE